MNPYGNRPAHPRFLHALSEPLPVFPELTLTMTDSGEGIAPTYPFNHPDALLIDFGRTANWDISDGGPSYLELLGPAVRGFGQASTDKVGTPNDFSGLTFMPTSFFPGLPGEHVPRGVMRIRDANTPLGYEELLPLTVWQLEIATGPTGLNLDVRQQVRVVVAFSVGSETGPLEYAEGRCFEGVSPGVYAHRLRHNLFLALSNESDPALAFQDRNFGATLTGGDVSQWAAVCLDSTVPSVGEYGRWGAEGVNLLVDNQPDTFTNATFAVPRLYAPKTPPAVASVAYTGSDYLGLSPNLTWKQKGTPPSVTITEGTTSDNETVKYRSGLYTYAFAVTPTATGDFTGSNLGGVSYASQRVTPNETASRFLGMAGDYSPGINDRPAVVPAAQAPTPTNVRGPSQVHGLYGFQSTPGAGRESTYLFINNPFPSTSIFVHYILLLKA